MTVGPPSTKPNEYDHPPDGRVLWNVMTHDPSAGVLICDAAGHVIWSNERGVRIYLGPDARVEDTIGRSWYELGFPAAWVEERLGLFAELIRSGDPVLLRTIWRGRQVLAWLYPVPPDDACPIDRVLIVSRESEADPKALGEQTDTKVKTSEVARLGELDALTPRELEVLALLGQGLSIKEISRLLFRSDKTIGRHRDAIGAKLGLHNKVDLAEIARRAGLTLEDVGRERV